MCALYKLQTKELDEAFLETVTSQFGEREIEVAVCEATEAQEDGTAYLLRSPANRERLLDALRSIEQGCDLVTFTVQDLR